MLWDHVSYRGPRPIHWSIYRLILNRVSVDTPLYDTHGVGQHIDRDIVSGVLVNYRLYIGVLSVKYRSILDRLSVDTQSISC